MALKKGNVIYRLKGRVRTFYLQKGFWKTLFWGAVALGAGVICVVAGFVLLVWSGFFGPLPGEDQLREIHHPVASEVYSVDSVLLGRYYLQDRTPVDAERIPENLKQALVSTEDVRFYEHDGVDVKSLLRVLI